MRGASFHHLKFKIVPTDFLEAVLIFDTDMCSKDCYYNNLDKTYIKIWDLLEVGLAKRDAPFHIPIFISGNDSNFEGRIIVLRGLDKENKIFKK